MRILLSLGVTLFGVWLLWSGHYTIERTLVLVLGIVSCLAVVAIVRRMGIVDSEGHPIHLAGRAILYVPWLLLAILRSNVDVALRILNPRLPVSPTLIRARATQKTALGKVIYANSITLTPGTVSVDVENDLVLVHALSRESARELAEGEMDRRVTAVEGGS
ncbi:MAG: Na+/H+ antiporter subunit E [Candidatus Latescibacteria bacterium]|nr:Na+/H+ antiporter subunit E [Candidatus Latescibacterota bacterium]